MITDTLVALGLLDPYQAKVERWATDFNGWDVRFENTRLGANFLAALPAEQTKYVLTMLTWCVKYLGRRKTGHFDNEWYACTAYSNMAVASLKRRLPWDADEILALLHVARHPDSPLRDRLGGVTQTIERHIKTHGLSEPLRVELRETAAAIVVGRNGASYHQHALRLRELAGNVELTLHLRNDDVWAAAAVRDILTAAEPARSAWARLVQVCLDARGSTPSDRWQTQAIELRSQIGVEAYRQALLRWLPEVAAESPFTADGRPEWAFDDRNILVLRGLIWLCCDQEDARLAQAIATLAQVAFRKIPQVGPRNIKLGNACLWALSQMPGNHGVAALVVVRSRIKMPSVQSRVNLRLADAAVREGLAPGEIEELSVPTFGLQTVGLRRVALGDVIAEIQVDGSTATLTWQRAGKSLANPPQNVKMGSAEVLAELKRAVADLRTMLPVQRNRIETLFLMRRSWAYDVWRDRYLDHVVVGTIARRLIWKFSRGDQATTAIWHAGAFVDRHGKPVTWIDAETRVELWHPLNVDPEVVVAWRVWLEAQTIVQPFKQAHREVYLLTDAERVTATYSNRFAAHVLRQHQFNALCAARGWRNHLRLMVDAELKPPLRELPEWGLRAEFWVEGIGTEYGVDTNPTGSYLHVATDQVRFYPLAAQAHYAHAAGGGYNLRGSDEPLRLEDIPALVLSEILRDVDLFVGVASVGNDPSWADGGPAGRHVDYWHQYSFGDLNQTARTRRQVLEALLPRLKIAGRCSLTDRFLIVRGDRRTYKIHLGSGNILMEPNDQYLCIVPAQGLSARAAEKVMLPFEGDQMFSVILSKAFLLADDTKITDQTIVRQLAR